MIVGRDVSRLDEQGVTRAAVETVAENTSDGIVAPLVYLALGGPCLGFMYKAVNTMDSMLGYVEPPYRDFGYVSAKMDDLFNFLPSRLSAVLMLLAGGLLGMDWKNGWKIFPPYRDFGYVSAKMDDLFNFLPSRLSAVLMLLAGGLLGMDWKNGWKIFRRDRFCHASPNSAQTEAACAGLMDVRLAGDAWYHGVLHKKPYIGDDLRPIAQEDIPLACRLLYATAMLALAVCLAAQTGLWLIFS